MGELLHQLQIGWPLTVTGLVGLGLQILALTRARKQPLLSVSLSGLGLLALLIVCFLMVEDRWAVMTRAVSGVDPATRSEMLEVGIPSRLGSLQVFSWVALFLLLQALVGAVTVGRVQARRAGARAGAFVGVWLASALLSVGPLCVGVMLFVQRWERIFGWFAGADPSERIPALLTAMHEPRSALTTGALAAGIGLLVSCVLISWLALRQPRAASPGPGGRGRALARVVTAAVCLAAALGLWHLSGRYVLPAPADGPVKRYIQTTDLPFNLVSQLQKDPKLALDFTENLQMNDDLFPPRSSSTARCGQSVQVVVTQKGIVVEGESVAAVKGGSVDATTKRDGASGYHIDPLAAQLDRHATRLKKIEKMTGGKMQFAGQLQLIIDRRTPYRLVSEVLYTAGQVGFHQTQLLTLAKHQPFNRRTVFRCVEAHSPRYSQEGTVHAQPAPCGRVVTLSADDAGPPSPRLNLTVAVTYRGFIVAGSGSVMKAPDGSMPTIKCTRPLVEGRCPVGIDPGTKQQIDGYDFRALERVITKIKRRYPSERCVIVAADRQIAFQTVIWTLDALRGEAGKPCSPARGCLFDHAVLSAGVQ